MKVKTKVTQQAQLSRKESEMLISLLHNAKNAPDTAPDERAFAEHMINSLTQSADNQYAYIR